MKAGFLGASRRWWVELAPGGCEGVVLGENDLEDGAVLELEAIVPVRGHAGADGGGEHAAVEAVVGDDEGGVDGFGGEESSPVASRALKELGKWRFAVGRAIDGGIVAPLAPAFGLLGLDVRLEAALPAVEVDLAEVIPCTGRRQGDARGRAGVLDALEGALRAERGRAPDGADVLVLGEEGPKHVGLLEAGRAERGAPERPLDPPLAVPLAFAVSREEEASAPHLRGGGLAERSSATGGDGEEDDHESTAGPASSTGDHPGSSPPRPRRTGSSSRRP
mmetsp:Transcript_12614/g.40022  ORF Transcript_12614/g.40022 Transcript_12614/m.40022 type:complete len:278 (-) Transcript_12614:271-1104(-)